MVIHMVNYVLDEKKPAPLLSQLAVKHKFCAEIIYPALRDKQRPSTGSVSWVMNRITMSDEVK